MAQRLAARDHASALAALMKAAAQADEIASVCTLLTAASPQTEVVSKTVPSLETMTHQKWFVPPAALLPLIQLTDLAFLPTATYVLGNWAGAVPELLLTVLLCSVLGELGRCRSPRLQTSMIFL